MCDAREVLQYRDWTDFSFWELELLLLLYAFGITL